jgi:hypothetical protein
MPINNIIKVAKPAIIKIIQEFAKNFENRHNEITKLPIFPAPFLFGSHIYRNQHFKFVRNIFKFLLFFDIRNVNWFSRHFQFSEVVQEQQSDNISKDSCSCSPLVE